MGSFNWLNIEAKCPSCKKMARIHCQTHIASDYGGDDTGMFHDRQYRLGDKMAWWPEGHKKFRAWGDEESGNCDNLPLEQAAEACYSDCQECKADLCVVILFENLRPIQVIHLSLESDWPEGYTA